MLNLLTKICMKKSIEKFLEFNGKTISFLSVEGDWYVAVKPICDVLGVDYEAQRKALKADAVLSELPSDQTVVAADGKLRKMVCLPERYIYGWLFSINSDSPGLLEFKKQCYDILFEHFHGGVRSKLKTAQLKNHAEIEHLQTLVNSKMQNDENFLSISKLKAENISIGQQIKKLDKEEEKSQLDLFRTQFN